MEEGIKTSRITWLTESDFDLYFDEGNLLKEKYRNTIEIGLGVEVGYNPSHEAELLERLKRRTWDHVGISCHFHYDRKNNAHRNLVSRRDENVLGLSADEANVLIRDYFTNLGRAVDVIPGDMVCHLDAVLRFHPNREVTILPWDLIDILLEKIKTKGIALEINTSGIPIRKQPFPCRQIITKAIGKGIPLLASSDAHRPEDVAYAFNKLNSLLN